MSEKIRYLLNNGQSIWLTQNHYDALAKLGGSHLLELILEDRDLKKVTNPAALFVALAVAIDAGRLHDENANDFDAALCYSNTPQGENFWRGFQQLLAGRTDSASDCFERTNSAVTYKSGSVTINNPWGNTTQALQYDFLTPSASTESILSTTGASTMSISNTVAANKTAATVAVKIKAGQALNVAAIAAIKKTGAVPMMLRGYLDSPFAPLVVANLVNTAAQLSGNAKAQQAADLMMVSAALTVTDLINVDSIINSLFEGNAGLNELFNKATTAE